MTFQWDFFGYLIPCEILLSILTSYFEYFNTILEDFSAHPLSLLIEILLHLSGLKWRKA